MTSLSVLFFPFCTRPRRGFRPFGAVAFYAGAIRRRLHQCQLKPPSRNNSLRRAFSASSSVSNRRIKVRRRSPLSISLSSLLSRSSSPAFSLICSSILVLSFIFHLTFLPQQRAGVSLSTGAGSLLFFIYQIISPFWKREYVRQRGVFSYVFF